jgi:hypothetical protein
MVIPRALSRLCNPLRYSSLPGVSNAQSLITNLQFRILNHESPLRAATRDLQSVTSEPRSPNPNRVTLG